MIRYYYEFLSGLFIGVALVGIVVAANGYV
jgi:hypothetical protein